MVVEHFEQIISNMLLKMYEIEMFSNWLMYRNLFDIMT